MHFDPAIVAMTGLMAVFAGYALFVVPGDRKKPIPRKQERVLIVGASSGVGRTLAKQYAARGAYVCVVARREAELISLTEECGDKSFFAVADFSQVEAMIRVRDKILEQFEGLDTLHVCSGVSALQPIMNLTKITKPTDDADRRGVQAAVDIAGAAIQGNFDGPLITALTFIPLMERTSKSPSIVLLNTLASVVAAPTRGLYAASKASSLLLYQALAIEHPDIAFTFMLPSTIEGDFRAGAVDAGPVREADPNKSGLKQDYVAQRCIQVVDEGTTGNIFMPWWPNALAPHLKAVFPSIVNSIAKKKYNFP